MSPLSLSSSPLKVRRSPRLAGSKPSEFARMADETSRRLSFETPRSAVNSPSQDHMRGSRRADLHSSAKQVCSHSFVDAPPLTVRDSSDLSHDGGADSAMANTNDQSGQMMQLHPSMEAVLVRGSVDLRNDIVHSPLGQLVTSESDQRPSGHFPQPRSSDDGIETNDIASGPSPPTYNRNDVACQRTSPRGAVCDGSDIDDSDGVRASQAHDKDGVYTFLLRMTVKNLRGLLKDMKMRQSGKKDILLARIMAYADIRLCEGHSFTEFMKFYRVTARFDSWRKHQTALDEKVPQYWSVSPTISQFLSRLEDSEAESFKKKKASALRWMEGSDPTANDGQQAVVASSSGGRNRLHAEEESSFFSINEFARLCIIIRDDEDAKAAFFATGQELTRSQMDAGFTRNSFWGVIESRFNDPGLKLNLNMVGSVDNVDSTIAPPIHRSASFLKERFFGARSSFTVCAANWSQSGQNDNSNFKEFAGTRDGELTAAGKRNMVLFICARMGTENEDSRFRSMSSRVIPFDRGVDEGEHLARDVDEVRPRRAEGSTSRRDSLGNSAADNESATRSIAQLSSFVIQRGREKDLERRQFYQEKREEYRERRQHRRAQHEEIRQAAESREINKSRKARNGSIQRLEETHKLIQLLRYATETLKSEGQDAGTELVMAAKRQKEEVFRALRMPHGTPEGLQGDMMQFTTDEQRNNYGNNSEDIDDDRLNGDCRRGDPVSDAPNIEEDEIQPN